uniref:Uncharacterized protein n=1 Tax=Mycena chlorophos TaxID=658473 RepID=A0ABQ0KWG0_MYCCL|nr:predicted protein [Mycena chlorophos]
MLNIPVPPGPPRRERRGFSQVEYTSPTKRARTRQGWANWRCDLPTDHTDSDSDSDSEMRGASPASVKEPNALVPTYSPSVLAQSINLNLLKEVRDPLLEVMRQDGHVQFLNSQLADVKSTLESIWTASRLFRRAYMWAETLRRDAVWDYGLSVWDEAASGKHYSRVLDARNRGHVARMGFNSLTCTANNLCAGHHALQIVLQWHHELSCALSRQLDERRSKFFVAWKEVLDTLE